MGYKGALLVAVLAVIAYRRVLALSCSPCQGRGPHDWHPNGTVVNNCGPKPTCSYGYYDRTCGCGCNNTCAKGLGEVCGGLYNFGGSCGRGLECLPSNSEFGICVSEEPQDPCSPGLEFFKHGHVYNGSNSVLTKESANDFTKRGAPQFLTRNREGILVAPKNVHEGRNMTYHLHPSGESCYTNFVRSYKCLAYTIPGRVNENVTCERDPDGPYCAALFRIDSGLYEGDVCRDTPELGNTEHPLESSPNPCSPGIVSFKNKHVYDRSDSVLTAENAKQIIDSQLEQCPCWFDQPDLVVVNNVYDGRNMTYHLHPGGQSCYTDFVESYRCSELSKTGYYYGNNTCERDKNGPYCAALFSLGSGRYEGGVCRDTPELGNTVHPLAHSPDPCSPGLESFKSNHVYDRSGRNLTEWRAKTFTISQLEPFPDKNGEGGFITNNTVYDGRNMTYHRHPRGESCYTNFVKSFKCLASSRPGYFNQESPCERDQDGAYCAALFSIDSGRYEGDVCRDTPELGNSVHPLLSSHY